MRKSRRRLVLGVGAAILVGAGGRGCGGFEAACIGIDRGTPLEKAAEQLEAAGGRPGQSTPTVKVWLGTGFVRTPCCNVTIDGDDKVVRTLFGKAIVLP